MPLLFVLLVTNVVRSNAGQTSRFMRRLAAGADIPENSSILAPPPGYNAPQQVRTMSHLPTKIEGLHEFDCTGSFFWLLTQERCPICRWKLKAYMSLIVPAPFFGS